MSSRSPHSLIPGPMMLPSSADVFPSIVVIACLITTLAGFVVCRPPPMAKKRIYSRSDSELKFILVVSSIGAGMVALYLLAGGGSELVLLSAFSAEIGMCVFELLYLGIHRRLPVDALVHHVCAPVSIALSLFTSAEIGLLAKLSLSINVSNIVLTSSRLWWRRTRVGLLVSLITCMACRIILPVYIVSQLVWAVVIDPNRPEWSRLYCTSMLMLTYLNCQLTFSVYRKFSQHR